MIDQKRVREIVGYTHQKQSVDSGIWHSNAILFHHAAKVLYRARKSVGEYRIRVASFNAGLSLELLIKAVLAKKNITIPTHHHLRQLSELAKINLNKNQKDALDIFEEMFVWVGRYPTPKKEKDWDEYHDDPQQKRKIRSSWGNMHTRYSLVRANPKTYPSLKNYMTIWKICLAEFDPKS